MEKQTGPDLIDRLMDAYIDWREECVALTMAYDRWSSGPAGDKSLAFAAYRAALDREEWACRVYADLIALISPGGTAILERFAPGDAPLLPDPPARLPTGS